MFKNKPAMAKEWAKETPSIKKLPMKKKTKKAGKITYTAKAMKKWEKSKADKKLDKKHGYKEGSKKDTMEDAKAMLKRGMARLSAKK